MTEKKMFFYNKDEDRFTENWEEATRFPLQGVQDKKSDGYEQFMLWGIYKEKIDKVTG